MVIKQLEHSTVGIKYYILAPPSATVKIGLQSEVQCGERHLRGFSGRDNPFLVYGRTGGGLDTAVLRYEFTGDREVNLLTTNVPVAFRGEGVAALLAKSALDFVVKENLRARISCWYIRKYISENPMSEYEDNIVD
ncbi:hypothetical protein SKAU_G00297770 [Synaphobranchus kaupii]|uniref:Protein NATD1 n=1 Tax=Synaphobranchus kaupii TaxID=118154 RepID=A0A9Q1IMR2_SYNKA|nr:hypothetical protein SKAU_G00297770 [Synaphobranchus kaupii]